MTRALEATAENKKGIEAANARVDRVVESLGGKLDTAIESINKVATRVEVLSSKLDDAQGRANKTLWRTPIVRRQGSLWSKAIPVVSGRMVPSPKPLQHS